MAEAVGVLSDATSVVCMTYEGLSVTDMTELRVKLFDVGARLRVMPKRLLKIASEQTQTGFEPLTYQGQVAIAWGDDTVAPAKVLYEFAKKHENVQLVAGLMDHALLTAAQVVALAQLPSREQLLAQLVGTIAAPVRDFQSVLTGVPRSLVYALQAVAEQKQAA